MTGVLLGAMATIGAHIGVSSAHLRDHSLLCFAFASEGDAMRKLGISNDAELFEFLRDEGISN